MLACALRALFAFVLTYWHASDSAQYLAQARAILAGGWLNGLPNGYPLMEAAVARLAGAQHLEVTLLILNILLSTATVYAVAALARELGGSAGHAAVAAFAAALWPNQLHQLDNLGSDIPAAFFLAIGVLLLARRAPIAGGLSIGAGAACRPILVAAVVAILAVFGWRRTWKPAAWFAAAAIAPLLVVAALSFSRGAGFTLDAHVAEVVSNADRSFGGAFVPGDNDLGSRNALSLYRARLRREPVYFLRQRAAAIWELWGSWPADNQSGLARQLALAIRFPLLLLAGAGAWAHRERDAARLAAAPIVALTLAYSLFYALARFTVPMEPLAIALAASVARFSDGSIFRCSEV